MKKAQAMLVSILLITAAALAIGLAIASISSSEINISVSSRQGVQAYHAAESCLENTLMRMARTTTSTPPPFTIGEESCTIEISGQAPYQIISTGQKGKAIRKIKATVSINNEVLSIQSWGEAY